MALKLMKKFIASLRPCQGNLWKSSHPAPCQDPTHCGSLPACPGKPI